MHSLTQHGQVQELCEAQKAEKDNEIITTRISAVEEALGPKLAKATVHINLDAEIQKLSLKDHWQLTL